MQQSTNPRGSITVSINATDCFNPYEDDFNYDDLDLGLVIKIENLLNIFKYLFFSGKSIIPNIEISSMSFSQSVEFPLTQKDTCTLSGQLQTSNGTGIFIL